MLVNTLSTDVDNLQLPAVLSTHIHSRTLHHPAIRSTRSSSCLILSQPPVTSHLMFSSRAISITAPLLRNDLPPELHTVSLPPPPLSSITRRLL